MVFGGGIALTVIGIVGIIIPAVKLSQLEKDKKLEESLDNLKNGS